ncbi:MAG: hypothetical protein ABI548_03470 [Polyangiaceae bacterium]
MRIDDGRFYCYMPGPLLAHLLTLDEVLNALVKVLEVPGKPAQLKRLSNPEKFSAIEAQALHLQRIPTSQWRGVELPEIIAGSLWHSDLPDRDVFAVFHAVKKEAHLAEAVAGWLREKGMRAYAEVPMGTKRPDLVGHRPGGLFSSHRVVSVELKNEPSQLKRGLDQMTTFGDYSHHVYMACTPALGAEYLHAHAASHSVKHWDPEVLNRKLTDFGFGLLIVAGPEVCQIVPPRDRAPKREKLDEVLESIKRRKEF